MARFGSLVFVEENPAQFTQSLIPFRWVSPPI
jgi:hypothetical protein